MNLKKIGSITLIILIILSLITFSFINIPNSYQSRQQNNDIIPVSQGMYVDLHLTEENITLSQDTIRAGETLNIRAEIANLGTVQAEYYVIIYLARDGNRTELMNQTNRQLADGSTTSLSYPWLVDSNTMPGKYEIIISLTVTNLLGIDRNPADNEAGKTIFIKSSAEDSELELETGLSFAYPGFKLKIITYLINNEPQPVTVEINLYYSSEGNESNLTYFNNLTVDAEANSKGSNILFWEIPSELALGRYILWAEVVEPEALGYVKANITFKILEKPDTSKTPTYLQIWFIIGLIALIIFFLTIIFSLIGVIPQDRLPIQPALVVMALVIMIIALVGNYLDPSVHLIGAQDIAGMVIIHPITALTAGFLVAGGLEAAGAFAAAADALGRLEKLKFKGKTVFGFVGTVVILTNIPTLIAMPCGRILGAALMPAALFFGYRVAKAMGDARMVGVVVFPFIVNAAASCGPSPLGGIGTIGEGLSKMPIGSFTTAQSTGIMICTGVCALFMRYITPMRPADLSDEDIKREMEANKKAAVSENDRTNVEYDPKKNMSKNSQTDSRSKSNKIVTRKIKGPPPDKSIKKY